MSIVETFDSPVAVHFEGASQEHSPLIDQLSEPIVGKWNVLVSQTNWEKGALILNWRNELIAAGLPNSVYSDEAWARRVGNVTAQHVGRLRRVAERFGTENTQFSELYWSHFYAPLEWDDAELWLEGAVQNDWSVAQMRVQRWEAIGAPDGCKPREEDVIVVEIDEDVYSRQSAPERVPANRIEGHSANIGAVDAVEGFDSSPATAPVSVAEPPKKKKEKAKHVELDGAIPATGEILMSLKGVAEFPVDLAEPLELLKVAVLNHKLAGWKSVSAEQVCRSLDALKMLAVAAD
jgi:hypothetical protein